MIATIKNFRVTYFLFSLLCKCFRVLYCVSHYRLHIDFVQIQFCHHICLDCKDHLLCYQELSWFPLYSYAFDFTLLYKHIRQLTESTSINIPSYDYKTHTRNNKKIEIKKNPIVIIEGIFSTYYDKLRKIIDLKVFLDIPEKTRKDRRIIRDKKSRARTEKSILAQYSKTVKPMYVKFVKPLIEYSDLIIKDNSINSNEINILNNRIKSILDKNYE